METSRDKTAETEGTTSIRLRYSRQFQNGGHAHTIDAEAMLAVGASPEKREEIIRELEAGVEQLARQITQRGSRPAVNEAHPQAPARPGIVSGKTAELPAPQPALPRPTPSASQPATPPVSESMPITPTASGERTITLPYFIDYIKKRWNMSRQEAMELLDVRELTGLNLREALFTLRAIKEPNAATNSGAKQARPTQQQPVVEAPRQTNRSASAAPNSRPPASQAAPNTNPIARAPGASASRPEDSQPPSAVALTQESKPPLLAREQIPDFAGSAKAPIPIQLGTVRDIAPHTYAFAEEDEEEYVLPVDDEDNGHRQAAESKLARLKDLRGGNAASPERLVALNNVIGDQISEEQLEQIIKEISGSPNKKRLKIQQVEELISWAKEDYFAEEVNAILEPFDEEEE